MTSHHSSTLVIEDAVLERRLRRPGDLVRLAGALGAIAIVGLLAYIAQSTTTGIEQDITQGANRLPDLLHIAASFVSGFGSLTLPVFATLDLLVRKRTRQLLESIGGLLAALLILSLASWVITRFGNDRLLMAMSGTNDRNEAVLFNLVLGGLAAFSTVARFMSRNRWSTVTIIVLSSIALSDIISGGITAAGLGISVLTGWAFGLLIRYLLGTDTTRPTGHEIAEAMTTIGHPLTLLRAAEELEAGRRYDATTTDGQRLDLIVLDRDLEGAGLAQNFYRSIRLRDDPGGAGTSLRRRLDRIALNSWALGTAGINTANLLAATEVGPDAAALVFEHVSGRTFAMLAPNIGDAELAGAWDIIRDLQDSRIAHRALTANNLLLGQDGRVYIQGLEEGVIAASDVLLRIDLAEALCTLAMLSSPERAIAAGRVVLGDAGLARALPALQPVALSTTTRAIVKEDKQLLPTLRTLLTDSIPTTDVEQIEIERIKPRTLVTIAAGTLAGYLLLTQLAQVNIIDLFKTADIRWMLIGLLFSSMTYVSATLNLMGVVPERLNFWKTFKAQWAASFATLVAPPTLGSVAINIRYLARQGLSNALAGASVAVAQVMAFFSHISLLFIAVIVAGTSNDLAFRPPKTAVITFVVVALLASFLVTIPQVRKFVGSKVNPIVSQVIPRLTSLANQPGKLGAGIAGVIMLNAAYCLCLVASVRAFSPASSVAAISLVYLAGSVVAQAAPTPGGLGAVEAAIAAGLTAAGIDGGIAVSSTLLFRVLTFWIPTIPGWLAFNSLQKSNDL